MLRTALAALTVTSSVAFLLNNNNTNSKLFGNNNNFIVDAFAEEKPSSNNVYDKYNVCFVQCFVRHGYRVPFRPFPNTNGEWRCSEDSMFIDNLLHLMHIEDKDRDNVLYRRKFILPENYHIKGNCYAAQLTLPGMEQLHQLGKKLRRKYVDQLHFLPEMLDASELYIRSTNSHRTLLSGQCLLEGLYPTKTTRNMSQPNNVITFHTMDSRDENMYGRSCARLSYLKKELKTTQEYKERQKQRAELKAQLIPILGAKFSNWVVTHNNIECMKGNGLTPEQLTPELEKAVAEEAGYETSTTFGTTEICRLSIGRFIDDFTKQMKQTLKKGPHKFMLYFGHDNTLSPLLSGFGILEGHPSMGTCLVFEVLEDKATGQLFVRALVNDKEMVMRGCDSALCPLQQFYELARELIPVDFHEECNA